MKMGNGIAYLMATKIFLGKGVLTPSNPARGQPLDPRKHLTHCTDFANSRPAKYMKFGKIQKF